MAEPRPATVWRLGLTRSDLVVGIGFIVVYLAVTSLARLSRAPDGAMGFWYPSAALGLSLLLVRGRRMAWALAAAILVTVMVHGTGGLGVVGVVSPALAATVVCLASAELLRRIPVARRGAFISALCVVALVAPAIFLALVATVMGGWTLSMAVNTWAAEAAPALAILPLAALHSRAINALADGQPRPPVSGPPISRLAWLGCAVAALAVSLFDAHPATTGIRTSYLPLVPVAWMALRYGRRGAVGSILIANVAYIAAVTLVATDDKAITYLSLLIGINITGLVIGTIADGRTRAERRFEEVTRFSDLIADNSSDIILLFDHLGRIEYASPSSMTVLGYAPESAIGTPGQDFIHPEDRDGLTADFIRILNGNQVHTRVVRARRSDGSYLWLERTGRSFIDPRRPAEPRVVMVLRDVTERRVLEESLRQSQKLESVGRLAGGIAHDFNNLLTAILGHASLLVEDDRLTEDVKGQAREMQLAAERAAGLTGQLLAFARRQVAAPRVIDLNEVVGGVDKLLKRVLTAEVRLTTALGPALWPVKADPGQIEQVLLNLGVNARDAMPQGGRITITTTNRAAEGGRFDPERGTGPHVELELADNGHGMSPETLAKVFEPFFTTKGVGKGTGLGLAVCDGIVRQAGGRIDVESTAGVGTRFRIRLPVSAEPVADAPAMATTVAARGHGETILVVEDETQVQELMVKVLIASGYRVMTAATGDDALAEARSVALVDALITDVVLPGISGPRLADAIRERCPAVKILFISGLADPDQEARKADWALGGFLQKPFTPETLRNRVRDLLDETLTPATGLARLPAALQPVPGIGAALR